MLVKFTASEAFRLYSLIELKVTRGGVTATDVAMRPMIARACILVMPAVLTPTQKNRLLELVQGQTSLGVVTPYDVSAKAKLLKAS